MSLQLKPYTFDVYWKDELTARVTILGNRTSVDYKRFSDNIGESPFMFDNPTIEQMYDFIESRCMSIEDKYSIMTPQPFDNFKKQAEYFGESKIKLNYNKIEKELPNIEGINNELLELIHKQLNDCRLYFPELKPSQNKKLIFSQHKSR